MVKKCKQDRLGWLTTYPENVPELTQDAITNNVCKLSKLRHLDISRFSVHGNNLGEYKNPNQVLRSIAENLPHLVSLDISGTNLAGTGTYESQQQSGVVEASSDASWPHSAEAHSDSREGSSQSTANSTPIISPFLPSLPCFFSSCVNETN